MKKSDPNNRAMTRREFDKARKSEKENIARISYDPWVDPFEYDENKGRRDK